MSLSPQEQQRYQRHLSLPEVGEAGQLKLKKSSVLIIGAGGLGSPVALYLAAAGVGRIGLVDFDEIDASNLQRQILYTSADVGQPKAATAAKRLCALNEHIEVRVHAEKLSATNALELLSQYDVVADGTDNFTTRYLVNDACLLTGKSNIYASIFRFEGQVSVFASPGGPCYRCLYPQPPAPGSVPSCAEGGVLGVLPGTVGTLQATEVLKNLLGIGKPLIGRLLLYDALAMQSREMKIKRDSTCPACGDKPTITQLQDYEAFCSAQKTTVPEISVRAFKAKCDSGDEIQLLDVREPFEHDIAHIEGAKLIPLGDLEKRLGELSKEADIVVHCKMGGRSKQAAELLLGSGFTRVASLTGGINAWAEEIDPTLAKY
jgi:molybdopterin/thiamine biosynthesis adenylyltransferase/rhodanese-related sulfurtransferase